MKIFDFYNLSLEELKEFVIDFSFKINKKEVYCHGISGWFDAIFEGSEHQIILSTNPKSHLTHWYQVRFLFKEPIFLQENTILSGKFKFIVNEQRSYNIILEYSCDNQKEKLKNEVYYLNKMEFIK